MGKLVITTEEELTCIINKSVGPKLDEISQLIHQKINPTKQKLSVKEVAEKLNVTELTVRNYIQRGIVQAEKIGRRILIDANKLEKSLAEVKSLKYQRR